MRASADTTPTPIAATKYSEMEPALSPDGRFLAYASDETGRYGPGDFALSHDVLVHTPASDPGGECICLISAEGPMRMPDMVR